MDFNPRINSDSILDFSGLKDVLTYYQDYFFISKKEEIDLIEELIKNQKGDYYKYLRDYEIAKEMNKRTHIIRFLYYSEELGKLNTEEEMNNATKKWIMLEKMIKKKNIKDMNINDSYILNKYFYDFKNSKFLTQLFNKDTIDYFKEKNNYIKIFNVDLKEILIYFKDYKFESKKKDIILVEEMINNMEGNFIKYLDSYKYKAIKMNKRTFLINEIYNLRFKGKTKTEDNFDKSAKLWEYIEEKIFRKQIQKIGIDYCFILSDIFNDDKYKELLLQIFNEEEIECYKRNNKLNECHINELKEILIYYKDYYFESKKDDIILIEEIINNKKAAYKIHKKYFEDFEISIKINERTPIINKMYKEYYKEKIKTEFIINSVKENWFLLEKCIKDKKIKKMNKDIKIILFFYFYDNDNKNILLNIFNQDCIDYFIEANLKYLNDFCILNENNKIKLKEILKYYKDCLFESKKEEIIEIEEIIKNGEIFRKNILAQLEISKNINQRTPIINYILDFKNKSKIKTEMEFKEELNNWAILELMIKNKKLKLMKKDYKLSLNKYFNDQKNKELIQNIFSKDEIEYFINTTNSEIIGQNFNLINENLFIDKKENINNCHDEIDYCKMLDILNQSTITLNIIEKEKKHFIEYDGVYFGKEINKINYEELKELIFEKDCILENEVVNNFEKYLEFLNEVEERIKQEVKCNQKLIIKLEFQKEATSYDNKIYNISCIYNLYNPNKNKYDKFKDENILIKGTFSNSQGFDYLMFNCLNINNDKKQ